MRHWSEQIEEFQPGAQMAACGYDPVAWKACYLALADVIDAREIILVGDELGRPAGGVGPYVYSHGVGGWRWLSGYGDWSAEGDPATVAELDRRLALVSS